MEKISQELQDALKTILKAVETRDQAVRDKHLRILKLLDLYWKNIHNVFWNDAVKDYRNINDNDVLKDLDTYYADKVINIYRAHGESIIAALSQDLPKVVFVPDDAENQDDLLTERAWTLISQLIAKNNNATLMLIRALYLLYNQGTIAAYIYSKEDEKNGTYQVPQYGKKKAYTDFKICPICGTDIDVSFRTEEQLLNDTAYCEYCEQEVFPIVETEEEDIPTITGYREEIKPRPCIEVYGMLNIRIPHFTRVQKECGYLILETESDKEFAQEVAGDDISLSNSSDGHETGRWARLQSDFDWEDTKDIVTWRRVWFRPWQFNLAGDKEIIKKLRKSFPKGAYFLMMNDTFIEAENESMDEHWVISENPLSSHIHAEPIGLPAKAVQDIRSEIVVLEIQSMEYGIPETFADPAVLDFDSYNNVQAGPGKVFGIKQMPAGRALSDAFTTLKTATFPKEAEEFKKSIDADGQFVLGDFPSIYGGAMQGGSKTYAEYSASQARALQRLSIVYKLLTSFYARVQEKAVRIFINDIKEDEKIVEKSGSNWVNIWIRRADLRGKIGSVEPETDNSLPMSWAQKKDALLKLLEMPNEDIQAVIRHPENAGIVAKYLGFPEMFIPGDDDRNKQLNEIAELIENEPIPTEELDEMNQPVLMPSVMVDQDLDNHEIEFVACLAWLNGDHGQDAKINNSPGYENVKLHARMHKSVLDMLAMQQAENESNSEVKNEQSTT